ncbi:RagB/SusD family nutrient uptake outer membrane protein [Chitinophaga horti]|uniref:RagB/SusD family nutrient uptake outer membrane protein n=1 Tax=Chitinophaga horti TaxID=2920382 RepID=A0ABY6IWF0_9BACT|nr:RagB/SusD family nutrient uptake outer membrane protein [Chitinophaga horti]UYQ91703.1 RagB/SusD family nutrient uptake outer membrane protein [Chitinophaga horti]
MKKVFLIICCSALLFGCRKLDQPNTREFTDEAYWRDSQDALDALASCYENMSSDYHFFGNEALSDNAFVSGTGFNGVSLIAGGSYDQANARVNDEWGYRFRAIRKCNIVTTNIDRVPVIDPALKKRIVAEARFIRAYSYFQLVNWFGDVPFYTNLITIDEAKTIGRTSKATILEFIFKELNEIRADLPTNTEYAEKDRGRITRGAAIALTARIRMFTGEWPEVKKECELLLGNSANGTYGLVANYPDLFKVSNEFNNEVILDLQYGGGRLYSTQRSFLPQTVSLLRATLVPTQDLVDDYIMTNGRAISEAGSGYDENNPYANRDPRLAQTIIYHNSTFVDMEGKTQTILTLPGSNPATNSVDDQGASPTGYYFRKFADMTAQNYNSGLNLPLIRYADVLLMYAEAMAQTQVMDKNTWDRTIRALRIRAKFTDAAATEFPAAATQAQLLDIVKRERRAELAFEGTRAFDIRRWKIAATVLNKPVRGIKVTSGAFNKDDKGYIIVETRRFIDPKHYLWPVPTFERDQNKNLGQNDDWQ